MDAPTLVLQDTPSATATPAAARAARPRGPGLDTPAGADFAALMALVAPTPRPPAGGAPVPAGGEALPPGGKGLPMPGCGLDAARPGLPCVPADAGVAAPDAAVADALVDARLAGLAALAGVVPDSDAAPAGPAAPAPAGGSGSSEPTPLASGPATALPPPMPAKEPLAGDPVAAPPIVAPETPPRPERVVARSSRGHGNAPSPPVALARTEVPGDRSFAPGDPVASPTSDPTVVAVASAGRHAAEPDARDPGAPTGDGPAPLANAAPVTVERSASTAGASPDAVADASPAHGRLDAETGTPQWQRELGQRLVESAAHGVREMRLQLQPEHLGPLEVRLRLHDSQVGVWFGASSGEVRDALQDSLPRLREMLAEGGLTMAGASVGQHSGGARERTPVEMPFVEPRSAATSFVPAADVSRVRAPSGRLIDAYA
ncbi:MAG: flagellar hook-length control protein FliK [Steroidobacteraceae bacterium]